MPERDGPTRIVIDWLTDATRPQWGEQHAAARRVLRTVTDPEETGRALGAETERALAYEFGDAPGSLVRDLVEWSIGRVDLAAVARAVRDADVTRR